ncbi:hypothetical protein OKW43_004648 [Paraburkholderia sp. WC7.3g]
MPPLRTAYDAYDASINTFNARVLAALENVS